MSDHGHGAAAEAHGDHQYEYHGEPTDEPGPDEPVTPGWLTLLGISLVLAVMLGFVATRSDGKTRAELSAGAPSAAPAPAAAPAPSANPGARVRPLASGAFRPGAIPSGAFPFPRPGMSAFPRVARPPGQFAVAPGGPAPGGPAPGGPGGPGGGQPPRRPPMPQPVPQ